ncbi:MAG TPA: hypothetical protein PLD10_20660 [Rhodopila sp.]|nr:hypothetical protein [Rhodopila sp.]
MPVRRVLLAAEMLRGAATTSRLLPLAVELADRGHDVSLALPAELRDSVAATGFPVEDAPRWTAPPPPGFVAVSFADILMHAGYATPGALRGLLDGWRTVLARTRPDLLVADFAPTAMLAAGASGIPVAAVGDGFSLPPLASPFPGLRSWADQPADVGTSVEGRVLAVVNICLGRTGTAEWRALRDMFANVPTFLCAFPELDHYTDRSDGAYLGAVFPPSRGPAAVWPAGAGDRPAEGQVPGGQVPGDRVYVDLDPRHPALPGLAAALDRLGLPTLIQAAALPPRVADALERGAIQVTTTGNRASLLAGASFVVCQGLEIAAPALLAGKPLLMLPVFVEQMMTLHRVAGQGLGHGIAPDADAAAIDGALRRLADDKACRLRAVNFSRSYDGYRPGIAVDAMADGIDALLG